jgi:hypothetical protein
MADEVEEEVTIQPWEQQPGEPDRWYARFREYLNLGAGRSVSEVANANRERVGAKRRDSLAGAWSKMLKQWKWYERAKAYDLHNAEQEAERIRAKEQELNDKAYALTEQIIMKVEQMLNFPLQTMTREEKDVNGRLVAQTTIFPSRWVMRDAAAMLKTAVDLMNLRQDKPTANLKLDTSQVVKFDLSALPVEVLRDLANGNEPGESQEPGSEDVGENEPD